MFDNILLDLFIIMVFGVGVYALLIAPRQRAFRKRQKLVMSLKPGIQVMTYGGMLGTVTDVDQNTGIVTLKVAEGIELRFIAASITGEFDAQAYAESAQKVLKAD